MQNYDEDYLKRQARLRLIQRAFRVVKDRLERAAEINKKRYDRRCKAKPLAIGDRVLLKKSAFTGRHKFSDE